MRKVTSKYDGFALQQQEAVGFIIIDKDNWKKYWNSLTYADNLFGRCVLIQQQKVETHKKVHISMTHFHLMNESTCGLATGVLRITTAISL